MNDKDVKFTYPLDVGRFSNKGLGAEQSLVPFVISAIVIGAIVSFLLIWLLFVKVFGLSIGWAALAWFLLFGFIAFTAFRFLIFDETNKIKEAKSDKIATFKRFYNLRRTNNTKVDVPGVGEVDIFEFNDGSFYFGLEFKYGSNNTAKQKYSYNAFKEVYGILGGIAASIDILTLEEEYEKSKEYEELIQRLSDIEDYELSQTVLSILEGMLKETRESSNVDSTLILVRVGGFYDLDDIAHTISLVYNSISIKRSCFRAIRSIDYNEFMYYTGYYYGLEAVDLTSKRMEDNLDLELSMGQLVGIYRIELEDGPPLVKPKVIKDCMDNNILKPLN